MKERVRRSGRRARETVKRKGVDEEHEIGSGK